jgi:hypothetical protein
MHVDDVPALTMRLDPGHERDDAVDDAAEVDAEHPVPVLVGRVGDVVEEVDPGVVAEDVDVPEDVLGLVRGPRERLAVGHVELDRVDVELGFRGFEMVGPHVGDRHSHSGRDERLRHPEADSAAASGDERNSSFHVKHALSRPYRVEGTSPSARRRPPWRP